MKNRIILVVLFFVLVFTLSACDGCRHEYDVITSFENRTEEIVYIEFRYPRDDIFIESSVEILPGEIIDINLYDDAYYGSNKGFKMPFEELCGDIPREERYESDFLYSYQTLATYRICRYDHPSNYSERELFPIVIQDLGTSCQDNYSQIDSGY